MVYREEIALETAGHGVMHEITKRVEAIAVRSGIRTGIVHVFNIGSTGVVGTIEYEPGLERDLPEMLDRLIPPSLDYGHERAWNDGNGHSHLQATMMGARLPEALPLLVDMVSSPVRGCRPPPPRSRRA